MKKVYIIIAILASLLLAAMLIGIGYGIGEYTKPQVVVKTQVPTPTPTPEPEITPTPTPDYITEAKKNAPKPVTEREYVNYECGYKITFPENWMGWFLIDDTDAACVAVKFYGKSDAGRYSENDFSGYSYGTPCILIFTHENPQEFIKESFDGNANKIGSSRGKDYYVGRLFLGDWFEYHANNERNTPEERALARQDDLKYREMKRDTVEGGFLDLTFEEIK